MYYLKYSASTHAKTLGGFKRSVEVFTQSL